MGVLLPVGTDPAHARERNMLHKLSLRMPTNFNPWKHVTPVAPVAVQGAAQVASAQVPHRESARPVGDPASAPWNAPGIPEDLKPPDVGAFRREPMSSRPGAVPSRRGHANLGTGTVWYPASAPAPEPHHLVIGRLRARSTTSSG